MLFKDMTNDELSAAYRATRNMMVTTSAIGTGSRPNSRTNRRSAASFGRLLRDAEIIEAIADKRGVRL